jgi:signal transduction histidine kinase
VTDDLARALAEVLPSDAAGAARRDIPASWDSLPRGALVLAHAPVAGGHVPLRLCRAEVWRATLDESTDLSAAVRALETAGRAARRLAHDLQSPLGALLGALELRGTDGDTATLEAPLRALAAAQSARAGRFPARVNRGPTEGAVVEASLDALAAEFRRHGMRLACDAPPAILPMGEDVARSAAMQLVENALDAIKLGGTSAQLCFDDAPDATVIRVCDDGPGMRDAHRAAAGRRGWSPRGGDHGLGLWSLWVTTGALGGAVALAPREGGGTDARFALRR